MILVKLVQDRLKDLDKLETQKTDAIRKAEALSDQYSYIKPKTEVPTPERYFGLPRFSK